jgi:hypothetical protein
VRGIVMIDSAVLDDKVLDRWIGQARSYLAGLPPKQPNQHRAGGSNPVTGGPAGDDDHLFMAALRPSPRRLEG